MYENLFYLGFMNFWSGDLCVLREHSFILDHIVCVSWLEKSFYMYLLVVSIETWQRWSNCTHEMGEIVMLNIAAIVKLELCNRGQLVSCMRPVFIFSFPHNRQSIWRGFVCRKVHGTSSLGSTICEGDKEKVWRETVVESEVVRWTHYRFELGQMMPPFTTRDDGHEHKPEALTK